MGSSWEKLDSGAENWPPVGEQLAPAGEAEKWGNYHLLGTVVPHHLSAYPPA